MEKSLLFLILATILILPPALGMQMPAPKTSRPPGVKVGHIIFNYAPKPPKRQPKNIIFSPIFVRPKRIRKAKLRFHKGMSGLPLASGDRRLNAFATYANPFNFYTPKGQPSPVAESLRVSLPGKSLASKYFTARNKVWEKASEVEMGDYIGHTQEMHGLEDSIKESVRLLDSVKSTFDMGSTELDGILHRIKVVENRVTI